MEKNEKEKAPKATVEQAERLDYVLAELEKVKNAEGAEYDERRSELYQEYYDTISKYDWYDEVFEENGKKGMKDVKGKIVVPAIYDDFCMPEPYFHKSMPVGAKKDGKVALVTRDGTGLPQTEFEYHYAERIPFTAIYAVWKSDDLKHFALMAGGKVFTPYEIEAYGDVCDGAIRLAAGGKIGLLAYELGLTYIRPEYDDIYDEGIGEYFVFVKDGKEGRVTLDKRFISNEDFDRLSEEEQDKLEEIGFIYAPDFD